MKMKLFSLFIGTALCLLSGCKRYYAINMLGEDNVDVTYLVKKKHFVPIYNPYKKSEITGLIDPCPLPLTNDDIQNIQLFLENKGVQMPDDELAKNIIYRSTYFITWYPVDCFDLNIEVGGKQYYLEVRKEYNENDIKDRLILPSDKDPGLRFKVTDNVNMLH